MDNFALTVTSEGREEFNILLGVMFKHAPGSKATHYSISEKHGITLYWHDPERKEAIAFPYEMGLEEASHFVWGWLKKAPMKPEPDHDGSNGKGFFMTCDYWGHAADSCYGFVSVKPDWAMYGK